MVLEAIRLLRRELDVPLIGFAGRALHPRVLRDRGREVLAVRAHQGAHVRGPGRVARPLRAAREGGRRIPRGPGRGRRAGGAGLRLLGGRARRGRLPRVRAAARARDLRPRAGRALHPLRDGHRPPAGRAARGGRRRDRRGLAHAARRGLGAHRRRPRGAGEPRSHRAARPARAAARPRGRRAAARGRAARPRLQPRPRDPAHDRRGQRESRRRAGAGPHARNDRPSSSWRTGRRSPSTRCRSTSRGSAAGGRPRRSWSRR